MYTCEVAPVMSNSFETLQTTACQAPLSRRFSRQEYWSGLSRPPPGDLPHPGIRPTSLMSPALAGRFFTTSTTFVTIMALQLSVKKMNFSINDTGATGYPLRG